MFRAAVTAMQFTKQYIQRCTVALPPQEADRSNTDFTSTAAVHLFNKS